MLKSNVKTCDRGCERKGVELRVILRDFSKKKKKEKGMIQSHLDADIWGQIHPEKMYLD